MATRLRRAHGMLNAILADHHDTSSQQAGFNVQYSGCLDGSNLATWSSDWALNAQLVQLKLL
jgi:hypothetical protein